MDDVDDDVNDHVDVDVDDEVLTCSSGVVAIPGLCPHCGAEVKIEMKNCPTCKRKL